MRTTLACAMFALAVAAGAEDKVNANKLVGKWESKDAKDTVAFTKDGKVTTTWQSKGIWVDVVQSTARGTYKVEGNKLEFAVRIAGDELKYTVTITKLTDNEMEYQEDKGGAKVAFKRAKPADIESDEAIEKKIKALLVDLDSKDAKVRVKAIGAIGAYGPKAAIAVDRLILVWLRYPGPRLGAANAKRNEDHDSTYGAKMALSEIGKPAVKPLIDVLKGSVEDDRLDAIRCLGYIGPDAAGAVDHLIPQLRNNGVYGPIMRESAAAALGKIGPGAKAAKDALTEALKDPDKKVRAAAAEALKKIDKK